MSNNTNWPSFNKKVHCFQKLGYEYPITLKLQKVERLRGFERYARDPQWRTAQFEKICGQREERKRENERRYEREHCDQKAIMG